MGFNSSEFSWCDMSVTAMGRTYERITKLEYDVEVDKKYIYGRGKKVKGIQEGNEKPGGVMELGQSEIEAMLRKAQETDKNAKLTDISFDIQVHYLKGTDLVKDRIVGATFTKNPKSLSQGDSDMKISLPFMMMDVLYNVA